MCEVDGNKIFQIVENRMHDKGASTVVTDEILTLLGKEFKYPNINEKVKWSGCDWWVSEIDGVRILIRSQEKDDTTIEYYEDYWVSISEINNDKIYN